MYNNANAERFDTKTMLSYGLIFASKEACHCVRLNNVTDRAKSNVCKEGTEVKMLGNLLEKLLVVKNRS